jgi:hypothetical protein
MSCWVHVAGCGRECKGGRGVVSGCLTDKLTHITTRSPLHASTTSQAPTSLILPRKQAGNKRSWREKQSCDRLKGGACDASEAKKKCGEGAGGSPEEAPRPGLPGETGGEWNPACVRS